MIETTNVATIQFEWDSQKALSNQAKHNLSFEVAARVFFDQNRFEAHDTRKAYGEVRFVTIGIVSETLLCVAYTIRNGNTIRLISARCANAKERKQYSQAQPEPK